MALFEFDSNDVGTDENTFDDILEQEWTRFRWNFEIWKFRSPKMWPSFKYRLYLHFQIFIMIDTIVMKKKQVIFK